MKILIITGCESRYIPSMNFHMKANPLMGHNQVNDILSDIKGHDITVLRLGDNDEKYQEYARTIIASSVDDLIARFEYLVSEVKYDCVLSLFSSLKLIPDDIFRVYKESCVIEKYHGVDEKRYLNRNVSFALTFRNHNRVDDYDAWQECLLDCKSINSNIGVINVVSSLQSESDIIRNTIDEMLLTKVDLTITVPLSFDQTIDANVIAFAKNGYMKITQSKLTRHISAAIIELSNNI